MRQDARQKIVQMVIDKMRNTEKAPWDAGFIACPITPVNRSTGKAYRGVNLFLLTAFGSGTNEYVTYRQAEKLGGKVRKGEHGLPIVWYTMWNRTKKCPSSPGVDEESDEICPYLKSSTVFEVGQCDGLTRKRETVMNRDAVPLDQVDAWFQAFCQATQLRLEHGLQNAGYSRARHVIRIRDITEYRDESSYYQTLFHESVHSTMDCMHRPRFTKWGDHRYSEEEIVAEMGSLFLCHHFGIEKQEENSAAYLESWGKNLNKNPLWLFHGIKKAEQAVDYMLKVGGEVDGK